MFKRLKQKLESESEGEQSPVSRNERRKQLVEVASPVNKSEESTSTFPETPESHKTQDNDVSEHTPTTQHVIARVHQLLQAGRAQNDAASGQKSELTEPAESSPTETPNKDAIVPQSPGKHDYKNDDLESGKKYDVATKEELLILAKKQEKALSRYKTKFSEVVDAYKNLQKENEKLQFNIGQSQDKQIRKISELKETIELEKNAKMHMEDSLRIAMEEKDDLINVLKTQVNLLKKKSETGSDLEETNEAGDELDNRTGSISNQEKRLFVDKIKELEVTVDTQAKEIAELKEQESSLDGSRQEFVRTIERLKQEKLTAIQEMMNNVESIMEERNKCDLERKSLDNELHATKVMLKDMKLEKEEMVQKMDKTLENNEASEKNKLAKLKDEYKASAELMLKDHSMVVDELKRNKSEALEVVKQQHTKRITELLAEKEEEHKQALQEKKKQMDNVISQKEGVMKAAYSEKVKEVELAVEEQELQKHAVVKRKFEEISQLESRIQELEEQLQRNETSKKELIESQKKNKEAEETIQKNQNDFEEAIQERETQIKKHEEENKILAIKSKALQGKLSDMTSAVKKSEQAAMEREKQWKFEEEKHTKQLKVAIKEIEEKKQSELAIASKKRDNKVSEMKKIVKQLRGKLTEKENEAKKVQENMENVVITKEKEREELVKQTDADHAKMQSAIDSLNLKCATLQQRQEEEKRLTTEHEKTSNDREAMFNHVREKLEDKTRSFVELEKKIAELMSDHDGRMSEFNSEHRIQMEKLNENFQRKLTDQKKSLEEEKNIQQIRMSKETELKVQEMKKIVNELRNNLRESELREEGLKENLDAESNLRERLEKDLNDKQESLQKSNLHSQDYKDKIDELKSQINTLNQDRETAFKEKEAEKVLWMNEIESKFNRNLKEKDDFLNNTIEQLTKENELNVDDIASNYEAIKDEQLRSLQERHQEQIAELNNVHERTMTFARKEADESCERLASEAKEREDQLLRQNEDLRVRFGNKKSVYERQREEMLDEVAALTKELQLKDGTVNELENTKVTQEAEINQLKLNMEEKLMGLIETHRQETNKLERESEEMIQEMSCEHNHFLDKRKYEMSQMKVELESKFRNLEHEHITQLQEVKESYETKGHESIQRLLNENTQLKEIFEKQQRESEKDGVKQAETYENLQKKYDEYVDHYKESCLEKKQLKDELESVKSQRDQAKLLCDEMKQTLEIEETKHIELVDLLNLELEGLKNCGCDLEEQIAANNGTIKKLQNDLSETSELHEKEKQRFAEESDAKCAEIRNELRDRNEEMDDHLKRIQSESQVQIDDLKENVTQLQVKINEMLAEQEMEVESYKKTTIALKKRIKALSDEGKKKELKLSEMTDEYEKVILEMKQREENLRLEVDTSHQDSRTIDEQIKKLLTEKQELETLFSTTEEAHRHEMREADEQLREAIAKSESELMKTQEMTERIPKLEKDKRESLENLRETLSVENKRKLLEMKKKAETKIASLRKQLTNQLEVQGKELSLAKESVKKLGKELEEQRVTHSDNVQRMAIEHETIVQTKIEEVECQKGAMEDSTKSMVDNIAQLAASEKSLMVTVENLRIQKMEALREQSLSLKEDHTIEVDRVESEHKTNTGLLEKRLQAKLEEQDYENNSKIKQLVKQFQAKLAGKDQEIQDTLAEAIENSQKEEQQLVVKYEEDIVELKKELKYREDEMIQLKMDSEDRLNEKEKSLSDLIQSHEQSIEAVELDYQSKIGSLNAKHEEDLKSLDQSEQLIAIEQKYEAELGMAQKGHSAELIALEKKLKNQMKKNQTEMKKLLNAKEAEYERRKSPVAQTNGDAENQNDSVDVLKATIERLNREMDLLREREQLLQNDKERPVDNGPKTPQRPAELNLTSNPFSPDGLVSPSSYPGETEYEYLRNILFQYMMGKQKKQLSKVLATIVHFTPSQYQQIVQKENEQDAVKVSRADTH